MITAEQLLAIEDRDVQKVAIRGGELYVRSLTVTEHMAMEAANAASAGDVPKLMTNQIEAFVCDETGKPVFSNEQAERFVRERHPDTIKKVVEAALNLNGIGKESREDIKGNS